MWGRRADFSVPGLIYTEYVVYLAIYRPKVILTFISLADFIVETSNFGPRIAQSILYQIIWTENAEMEVIFEFCHTYPHGNYRRPVPSADYT